MTRQPGSPAGWYADPTGRQALRWFDGRTWTAQVVSAAGTPGVDPLAGAPPVTTPATAPVVPAPPVDRGALRGRIAATATAGIGCGFVLLGATVLPWVAAGDGSSAATGGADATLIQLVERSTSGLFVTSRIFWRGAVFGALGLTATAAVAALFRSSLRVAAALCATLTVIWLASTTLMVISRSPLDGTMHIDVQWFADWGVGLWATAIGVVACGVSTLLPRTSR